VLRALRGDDLCYPAALRVWTAPREVVERFVESDPYVVQGLVTGWTIRPWAVVVG
jgi:uncharacterized protein